MRLLHSTLLAGMLAVFTACGTATTSGPQPPATSVPAAPAPTVSQPAQSPARAAGVIATFRVGDTETYKVLLTDPADIEIARTLLRGEEAPTIPNGVVVRGEPSVNQGYSWHIDPDSIEFVDMTMEVCDGRPSDVEQQIITSDRFCPWSAKVIAVDDINDTTGAAASDTVLVSLHQSGGIAGMDEMLTIYADGRVESVNQLGQVMVGQVAASDLDILRGLLSNPELAVEPEHTGTAGADQITYEITLMTDGMPQTITTMDGAKNTQALDQVLVELARLRPTGGA